MFRLIEKLKNRDREDGSSLIFAILVLMILLLATVVVTATATTAAGTARSLISRDTLKNAAEAGLQSAIVAANNSTATNVLESKRNVANAVTGTMTVDNNSGRQDGEIKWRWYTEQVVFPGKVVGYYVYSTGYSTDTGGIETGVTLRAQFKPLLVTGANSADGTKIEYYIGAESIFQQGITASTTTSNNILVESTAKVYTADSFYGHTPSGTSSTGASLATNGTVQVESGSGIQYISIDKTPSSGAPCSGTGCASIGISSRGYGINTENISSKGLPANCTTTLGIWRASSNGGKLNIPQDSCVTGLIFDINTTVPANWSNSTPLRIFNSGNTTIDKGVTVNTTNSPQSLKIYSTSGKLTLGTTGTGTGTSFSGYFGSVTGQCEIAGSTKYFGALSCGSVILRAGSVFYLDLASRGLSPTYNYTGQRKIWLNDFVEEL